MSTETSGAVLTAALAARQMELCQALSSLDQQKLRRTSRLPGWDRLTVVCHLRYGARASRRMTEDALGGRPTAFYPLGRERQREATLEPDIGESPADIVTSLNSESRRLDKLWQSIDDGQWQLAVDEPEDKPDLGSIDLWTLAMLRLTEVEVHGHDLDLDLSPWSNTFVSTALPMRLQRLPTRRSNHRSADHSVNGSWALVSTDGPSFLIQAQGSTVDVQETATKPVADSAIIGTSRQLLAFILGRVSLHSLQTRGDQTLAASFLTAFPAP